MASYKVAQDVEADDKLLGPFSFRQFIYLVIAVMAGIIAYGLSRLFLPLLVIPVPIIVFFLALALPLRKDQPMEIYLAAIVSYYVKPRQRIWQPDGVHSLIDITAEQTEDKQLTKSLSTDETEARLAYLATLADTQGWSIRHAPTPQTSMVNDVYNEAQSAPDSFADDSGLAQSFDSMIDKADLARRQEMMDRMHSPTPQAPSPTPAQIVSPTPLQSQQQTTPSLAPSDDSVAYNPYPSMRQHVVSPNGTPPPTPTQTVQPVDQTTLDATTATPQPPAPATPVEPPSTQQPTQPVAEPETTSENQLSPDIINLANNKDLSVETIAREAHRIEEKSHHDDDEVVISLR